MAAPTEYRSPHAESYTLFAGVDPGLGGAIVVINSDGSLFRAARTPTRKRGKKRLIDGGLFSVQLATAGAMFLTIEEVGTRTGEGAVGAFSFGRALGVVEGVAAARGAPVRFVRPQVWQSAMLPKGAGTTKERAVRAALERWPELADVLSVKVGWDIADAALIAEFGRTYLFGAKR